jgi:hypothetical protein
VQLVNGVDRESCNFSDQFTPTPSRSILRAFNRRSSCLPSCLPSSPTELVEIFQARCEHHGYQVSAETLAAVECLVREFEPRIGELGNGRFIQNVFDRCIALQCNRLATIANPSKIDLTTFLVTDIPTSKQLAEYLV